jgi:hypothetical protein
MMIYHALPLTGAEIDSISSLLIEILSIRGRAAAAAVRFDEYSGNLVSRFLHRGPDDRLSPSPDRC